MIARDLDEQIATRERELAALYQCRRARDHAAIKLAILALVDDWFTAHELRALVPFSPPLAAYWAGASAKSIGRGLKGIAEADERSAVLPPLRLLRHKTTRAATVWKIETYRPAGAEPAPGG